MKCGMLRFRIIFAVVLALYLLAGFVKPGECADAGGIAIPKITVSIEKSENPSEVSKTLQLVALLTVLSLAPAILTMLTSFTRIVIVLSFVKKSIATGAQPSQQILVGLALFLTMFIMAPVWQKVNSDALQPYLKGELEIKEAYTKGIIPVREFMFRQMGHSGEKELALFLRMAKIERPKDIEEVPTFVLIPAFVTSELKKAFQMGFVIFLPFLVIDIVVASVLLSMGMMMLPPVMISMPFKLLLFIMADGWHVVVRSLALSFR